MRTRTFIKKIFFSVRKTRDYSTTCYFILYSLSVCLSHSDLTPVTNPSTLPSLSLSLSLSFAADAALSWYVHTENLCGAWLFDAAAEWKAQKNREFPLCTQRERVWRRKNVIFFIFIFVSFTEPQLFLDWTHFLTLTHPLCSRSLLDTYI